MFGKGPLRVEKGQTLPGGETGVKESFPGTVTHERSLDTEEGDIVDKIPESHAGWDKKALKIIQVTKSGTEGLLYPVCRACFLRCTAQGCSTQRYQLGQKVLPCPILQI